MSKLSRQNAILELVTQETISNQEQLRKVLLRNGFDVTQATLSRDIHELGLVKTHDGYAVAQGDQGGEPALPPALRLVREFVTEVREAQNLLVIKTAPGSAQPVAAAIDAEGWTEIVGTVGGDDTILVISQNKKNAHKLAMRLRGMLA
ncbi:MAG TPA: arginine repressor [Clostridia bacterium]|nr:arginine repressor [Clostridia bacterium]